MSILSKIEAIPAGRPVVRGLRAYDRFFLARYPRVWVLRLHRLLPFVPLALLACCLWALWIPVGLKALPNPLALLLTLLIASIVVSIAWTYAILRDERSTYFTRAIEDKYLLISVFLGLLAINLIPFAAPRLLEIRIANLVQRETILEDITWAEIATRLESTDLDSANYSNSLNLVFYRYKNDFQSVLGRLNRGYSQRLYYGYEINYEDYLARPTSLVAKNAQQRILRDRDLRAIDLTPDGLTIVSSASCLRTAVQRVGKYGGVVFDAGSDGELLESTTAQMQVRFATAVENMMILMSAKGFGGVRSYEFIPEIISFSALVSSVIVIFRYYHIRFGLVIVTLLSLDLLGLNLMGQSFYGNHIADTGAAVAILVFWAIGLIMLAIHGGGKRIVHMVAVSTVLALSPVVPLVPVLWLVTGFAVTPFDDGWRWSHALIALSGILGYVALSPVLLSYLNRLHCKPW